MFWPSSRDFGSCFGLNVMVVFMYILIPQSSEQKSIICAKGRQMGMPT
jgi:hypothetical protein